MTVYTLFFYIAIVAAFLTLSLGVGHAKLAKYAKMQPLLWFLQYFVGSLLIFSGAVKALDPLGTAYKMADYFTLLLPVLSFMKPFALPFALLMIVVEVVIGINLILGHGKAWTTVLNLLMMLFFTFLTGYNYLTGYLPDGVAFYDLSNWQAFKETSIRVSDCGCFGDFMKLLPVETFLKDVLLTLFSVIIAIKTKDLKFIISSDLKLGTVTVRGIMTSLFSVGVTVFCLMNFYFALPMVDFRPFKEGTNIALARAECEYNAPKKKIIYVYKNRETGQDKIVSADEIVNMPFIWEDKGKDGKNLWEIQKDKTKEEIISKGCDSKITEMDGSKQMVFASNGYALWIVADDINPKNQGPWKKIRRITDDARKDGIEATAMYHHITDVNKNGNQEDDLENFRHEISLAFDFIQSDEKLVKTIIRSSPGLILLHNGTVVKMWHHRQLKDWNTIKSKYIVKKEAELTVNAKIDEYSPDGLFHNFKCSVLKVEKGQYQAQQIELKILDGNYSILKKLLDDSTDSGASAKEFKISFLNNPSLVSKIDKINFVPNGFMDSKRNAWQILSID